jgi:peptidoglycan L-alanyl-D-glutamate endopeptidase CwlK
VANVQTRTNFLYMLARLVCEAQEQGIRVICTSFFRSVAEQRDLFERGKSRCDGTKKVSKHQLGTAADLALVKNERLIWDDVPEYGILGDIWEDLGGIWGGRWTTFRDIFHFEV